MMTKRQNRNGSRYLLMLISASILLYVVVIGVAV
jgi:hypothetical protein